MNIQNKRVELNTKQLPSKSPYDTRFDHWMAVSGYVDLSLMPDVERLKNNGWEVHTE